MLQESSCTLLLVYYNFKGLAQTVRHFLCYLDLPFLDIHLDRFQEQRQQLPHQILTTLRGLQIKKAQLPLLIHQGQHIYELYPIMSYLCYRFDRQDLLGIDHEQKARVQQIIEIYTHDLSHTKKILFSIADNVQKHKEEGLELLPFIQKGYYQLIDNSACLLESNQFLHKQHQTNFILNTPTILDFYYIESSNYILGFFGSLDSQTDSERWKQLSRQYSDSKEAQKQQIRCVNNLRIMKKYQKFMKSQLYYVKHKDYLDSYKIVGEQMSEVRVRGLRKLWAGEYHQVE